MSAIEAAGGWRHRSIDLSNVDLTADAQIDITALTTTARIDIDAVWVFADEEASRNVSVRVDGRPAESRWLVQPDVPEDASESVVYPDVDRSIGNRWRFQSLPTVSQ